MIEPQTLEPCQSLQQAGLRQRAGVLLRDAAIWVEQAQHIAAHARASIWSNPGLVATILEDVALLHSAALERTVQCAQIFAALQGSAAALPAACDEPETELAHLLT